MRRLTFLLTIAIAGWTQTTGPKIEFEAASIKMTRPTGGGGHSHANQEHDLVRASMTLKGYIQMAYEVADTQVKGGPNWVDDSTYDLVAKLGREVAPLPKDLPVQNPAHLALQNLLADRFQLRIHRESKEVPGYALAVAKNGPKMKESQQAGNCGTSSNSDGGPHKFVATCVDMADFARTVGRLLKMPVTDETNLKRRYDFEFEWSPVDMRGNASADSQSAPTLFTILSSQLGLKLESRKESIDILVVDSAQRPTEN
jgi:uncharacterized protein (TIGR03435 family)